MTPWVPRQKGGNLDWETASGIAKFSVWAIAEGPTRQEVGRRPTRTPSAQFLRSLARPAGLPLPEIGESLASRWCGNRAENQAQGHNPKSLPSAPSASSAATRYVATSVCARVEKLSAVQGRCSSPVNRPTVLTVFPCLRLTVIVLVPARPWRLKTISMPSERKLG